MKYKIQTWIVSSRYTVTYQYVLTDLLWFPKENRYCTCISYTMYIVDQIRLRHYPALIFMIHNAHLSSSSWRRDEEGIAMGSEDLKKSAKYPRLAIVLIRAIVTYLDGADILNPTHAVLLILLLYYAIWLPLPPQTCYWSLTLVWAVRQRKRMRTWWNGGTWLFEKVVNTMCINEIMHKRNNA